MEVKSKNPVKSPRQRESFLREIIHFTIENNEVEKLLPELAIKVGTFYEADRVYFFKYNETGHLQMNSAAQYLRENVKPVDFASLPIKHSIVSSPNTSKTIQSVLSFSNLSDAPVEFHEFLLTNKISAAYVYEFFFKNIPFGRFVLHYQTNTVIEKEERQLLESILELTSNALYKHNILLEEKKAREEAESTGNELNAIINSIPAFISFITPDLKYKYFNKQYTEFFGISESDISTKDIKDVLGKDSYKISHKMMQRVLKGEKVSFQNELNDHQNNRKKLFHVQYIPNYTSKEVINGFFVLANDITEIKDTERRLEEKRERLRLAIESTNLGTWDHNFVTGTISLSNRSKQILGFDPNEEVNPTSFLKKVHESDQIKIKQLLENSIMDDQLNDYHINFRTANNKWVKASGRIFIDSENRNIRFIGLIEDISAAVHQEEYLKTQRNNFYNIFHEAPSLICVLQGRDLKFEYANEAFEKKFENKNIIGKKFIDVFPELVEQGYLELLNNVYKSGRTTSGKETLAAIINKNGELVEDYYNFVFHPKYDLQGEVDGVIIYANEISDLVKSRKSLESFLSIASHELKTPLTSVTAYANLLDDELHNLKSEQGISYMAKMDSNLRRLQNLINELLDISRIQAGKVVFNFKRFSYKRFIEETVENLRPVYTNYKINLSVGSDCHIYGDDERLEQVLNNLISNAIKYSPGKKEIWIEVCTKKDYVTTKVIDQGIGINSNKQNELFQRFFRVESKGFKSNGLGMGLYISKEIILKHKGDIGVSSKPNKGSTFYFNVPVYSE